MKPLTLLDQREHQSKDLSTLQIDVDTDDLVDDTNVETANQEMKKTNLPEMPKKNLSLRKKNVQSAPSQSTSRKKVT